jgi:hypothetical protein
MGRVVGCGLSSSTLLFHVISEHVFGKNKLPYINCVSDFSANFV